MRFEKERDVYVTYVTGGSQVTSQTGGRHNSSREWSVSGNIFNASHHVMIGHFGSNLQGSRVLSNLSPTRCICEPYTTSLLLTTLIFPASYSQQKNEPSLLVLPAAIDSNPRNDCFKTPCRNIMDIYSLPVLLSAN